MKFGWKSIKEFLKPTVWKVVLMVVLFNISYIVYQIFCFGLISGDSCFGYPFEFKQRIRLGIHTYTYNYLNLVLDILIWYIISCLIVYLIVHIYKKVRKR